MMALDSSGDSSAMFGSKIESSTEDPDLEDGEIASDEEGFAEAAPAATPEKEAEKETKKQESVVTTSPAKTPKSDKTIRNEDRDNDFEKDLQKLREEVERKKENRRDPKKRRENNERDNKNRRKRRSSEDSNKNRKEKKRKVEENDRNQEKDQDEDVDEDEMLGLNIRGASPTINLEKTEIWTGKQPILDPNWQFDDNSENDSDFDDRDDRKRRRRDKDRRNFKSNSREDREIKKRLQMKRKGKNRKDMDNSDMICINFMKGNCNKGNDCFYSHAVCPPKKMELCKFYLMDCCAKRDKCLYLHEEFPCKFFHTGLKCYSGKKCKFSHDPLNSLSKDILLKHLETAPKEILGDFPRLSRDCAETMVNNKTTGKPNDTSKIPSLFDIQVTIPPEFQNSGDKSEERTTPPCSPPPNVKTSPKTKPKEGRAFYQDVDINDGDEEEDNAEGGPIDFAKELEAYKSKQMQSKESENAQKGTEQTSDEKIESYNPIAYFSNSLSGSNKTENRSEDEDKSHRKHRKHKEESGEAESDEKEERRKKRREEKHKSRRRDHDDDGKSKDDDRSRKSKRERRKESKKSSESSGKSEISPAKINEDGTFGGIKFKIINRKEIRKSSDSDKEKDLLLPMKIEKPNEFLSSDDEKPLNYFVKKESKKKEAEGNEMEEEKSFDDVEKFGVEVKQDAEDETDECENENQLVIETNDDQEEEEKPEPKVPKHLPKKQQELFMRIQAQQQLKLNDDQEKNKKEDERKERKTSVGSGGGSDAEVGRTPSPEPADENWYSSDDEEVVKKESTLKSVLKSLNNDKKSNLPQNPPTESTRSLTPPPPKPKIEITALNDLSKINITELLSSIRQVTSKSTQNNQELKPSVVPPSTSYEPPKIENPVKMNYFGTTEQPEKKEIKDPRLRDPRTSNVESKVSVTRRTSDDKPFGKSIYDSVGFKVDARDSDLRFQSKIDSDERVKNLESIVPFGDVDLRTFSGNQPGKDFDMRNFGLPFKPAPVHTAATEIDASLNSHAPISYRLVAIEVPVPDFSALKISPNDPQVKKDPRLRRLFRVSSTDNDTREEQKKAGLPTDPRQRKHPVVADTPKSPTESPFSPKQNEQQQQQMLGNNPNLLSTNLLLLAQLGLSAAAGGAAMFDPRLQQLLSKNPQELEMLRNQLSNIKSQSDFDVFRNQLLNAENADMMRPANQPLLPTPGMGLLGPAPGFMMPGMGMPDPSVMMGAMGQMGFDPRFAGGGGNAGNTGNDDDVNDSDGRHFNRNFRNDRRGRGNWRGNRDRNWDRDNRRHKREDRDRSRHNRDRDERREKKRSSTPD